MFRFFSFAFVVIFFVGIDNAAAQTAPKDSSHVDSTWVIGGGLGLDFAHLLYVNPRAGAGENRIGIGGNTSFYANYKERRFRFKSAAGINFGIQRLGRGARPFQKSQDEVRLSALVSYNLTKTNPFAYALDFLFLSQIAPNYEGNFLTYQNSPITHPISQFFAPATLVLSPGMTYKPSSSFTLLVSPASFKTTIVSIDGIARLGNATLTNSLHGNPLGKFATAEDFRKEYGINPKGQINDSTFYAPNFYQIGATIKLAYQQKFFKDDKGKARISFSTSLNLFSNYLRQPQNIDVEWISQTDVVIFKGLSLTFITNLFYDYDILVQLDKDKDINTGINGYETTGRAPSYMQTLLLKYNFIF